MRAPSDGRILAIWVPRSFDALGKYLPEADDRAYVTDAELPLQVVVADGQQGYLGEGHIHPPLSGAEFPTRHKVVVCLGGAARMHIGESSGTWVESIDLQDGDVILITEGHRVEILADATRLIEIKQGPYPGTREAERTVIELRPPSP